MILGYRRLDNIYRVLQTIADYENRNVTHVVVYMPSMSNLIEIITPYLKQHNLTVQFISEKNMSTRMQRTALAIAEGKTDVVFILSSLIDGWRCDSPREVITHVMHPAGASGACVRRIEAAARNMFIRGMKIEELKPLVVLSPLQWDAQASCEEAVYDLMQKVYAMCKGTKVSAFSCVMHNGVKPFNDYELVGLLFDRAKTHSFENFEFAIAIVENKPVFRGDRLYADGEEVEVYAECNTLLKARQCRDGKYVGHSVEELSWTPSEKKPEWYYFEIDAPVMVRHHGNDKWYPACFAGVEDLGGGAFPIVFQSGNSWTSGNIGRSVHEIRALTEEELRIYTNNKPTARRR